MRAPLRVALGGGGTDLPSYYREHGGLVVSSAIDKYVFMTVSARFQSRFVLKHLEWEEADHPGQVRHPILRAALAHHWEGGPVELASVGDAPPGTGLGSSGASMLRPDSSASALIAHTAYAPDDPRPVPGGASPTEASSTGPPSQ